ncbi:hypothetical protein CUJ84_Chr003531 [Rhizobium leguminosarum]|uniref:Uncharacterized protein n=1 Tax=Rhizobium leguminosarum TaxID=384 RepID=A0A2K9Z6I2_RHILE|nr:hypothetical protein CUJ84_Chr003531 [Rhizobium leguminosarum]
MLVADVQMVVLSHAVPEASNDMIPKGIKGHWTEFNETDDAAEARIPNVETACKEPSNRLTCRRSDKISKPMDDKSQANSQDVATSAGEVPRNAPTPNLSFGSALDDLGFRQLGKRAKTHLLLSGIGFRLRGGERL